MNLLFLSFLPLHFYLKRKTSPFHKEKKICGSVQGWSNDWWMMLWSPYLAVVRVASDAPSAFCLSLESMCFTAWGRCSSCPLSVCHSSKELLLSLPEEKIFIIRNVDIYIFKNAVWKFTGWTELKYNYWNILHEQCLGSVAVAHLVKQYTVRAASFLILSPCLYHV